MMILEILLKKMVEIIVMVGHAAVLLQDLTLSQVQVMIVIAMIKMVIKSVEL